MGKGLTVSLYIQPDSSPGWLELLGTLGKTEVFNLTIPEGFLGLHVQEAAYVSICFKSMRQENTWLT